MDKKKRYIIEITYTDDKGLEVESLDITTDDLEMEYGTI